MTFECILHFFINNIIFRSFVFVLALNFLHTGKIVMNKVKLEKKLCIMGYRSEVIVKQKFVADFVIFIFFSEKDVCIWVF